MDAGVGVFSRRRLLAGALAVGVLLLTLGMALSGGGHALPSETSHDRSQSDQG